MLQLFLMSNFHFLHQYYYHLYNATTKQQIVTIHIHHFFHFYVL